MRIDISALRKAVDMILSEIENEGIREVDLSKDYYWSIPADQRYDPYNSPKELTLGQLSEDWKETLRIVNESQPPAAYQLEWVSALLRYVAERR